MPVEEHQLKNYETNENSDSMELTRKMTDFDADESGFP